MFPVVRLQFSGRFVGDIFAEVFEEMMELHKLARVSLHSFQRLQKNRRPPLTAGGDKWRGLHLEEVVVAPDSLEYQRFAAVSRLHDCDCHIGRHQGASGVFAIAFAEKSL